MRWSKRRPRQALCGIELRSPRPFTFQGFADFNGGYVDILKSWDILLDGLNPVARTNVAPEVDPPGEPLLYGFSYTVPSGQTAITFVVAGAGELVADVNQALVEVDVVPGESEEFGVAHAGVEGGGEEAVVAGEAGGK